MIMAKAWQKAEQGKQKSGQTPSVEIPNMDDLTPQFETNPGQVPMMYRAQVRGRCSWLSGDHA